MCKLHVFFFDIRTTRHEKAECEREEEHRKQAMAIPVPSPSDR